MRKDIVEKRLEDHNDVFADIFNNLVFQGERVLEEERLTPLPTEAFTRTIDGNMRQGNRDVRKADGEYGNYRLICSTENQTACDNTMPERIMGYEYAGYEEQIATIIEKNRKDNNPAYSKRIHDNQRLAPIVTAVLYWGNPEWQGPKSLHDMACKNNPEEMKAFMSDNERVIRHPEEFLDAMSEVASDGRYKIIREQMRNKENDCEREENVTMWKIEDEIENRGIQNGELLKIITLTKKKYQKGKDVLAVAEDLEESVSAIQPIYELIQKNPDKDEKYILEQYQKNGQSL